MLLAIDAGNSQIALGLGDAASWHARWRLETDRRRTADEYGVIITELFELAGQPTDAVSAVVIACVVPSLTPLLNAVGRQVFGCAPLVLGPGVHTGMAVHYDPPAALGSDRLADAVAARARYGAPVVVVDFGTATTFNVVGRGGAFDGGAIAPGVGLAADALAEAGARLHRIDLVPPADMTVVGRNTDASMRSGVLFGYAGLVEGILARFDRELGVTDSSEVPVVATGGMSGIIAPLVGRITHVAPDLTLDGLREVGRLNGAVP